MGGTHETLSRMSVLFAPYRFLFLIPYRFTMDWARKLTHSNCLALIQQRRGWVELGWVGDEATDHRGADDKETGVTTELGDRATPDQA